MDITEIMSAVIAIIAAIVSLFLIPYIKTKFTEAQRKRIIEFIEVAVKAAEQLYPSTNVETFGKEKLQYVSEYLKTKGIVFDVDDITDEIRMMIESAVLQFGK